MIVLASTAALFSLTLNTTIDGLPVKHPSFRWSDERVVEARLRSDGSMAVAALGIGDSSLLLIVETPRGEDAPVEIPVDSRLQFGVCGTDASLRVQETSERPFNATGEYPEGYSLCETCVELVVEGGGCDPIHFYWNHVSDSLDWWRP